METFGQRLKRLRTAAGKSRLELAEYVGITRTSITLLENGQSGSMKGKNLLRAAEFLDVTPEALEFGEGGDRVGETPGTYKTTARRALRKPAAVRNVPVIGFAIATPDQDGYFDDAGYPPGAGEGYVPWPTRDANAYALRVRGDSMQPRIRPGEVILVEPGTNISPGSDVVVRCKDGRKMVKQLLFQRGQEVTLGSINIAHRQVTLDVSEIESMHYVSAIVPAAIVNEGHTDQDQGE
jgi:phage repressor protein C with HTH and peptisase S24 domain